MTAAVSFRSTAILLLNALEDDSEVRHKAAQPVSLLSCIGADMFSLGDLQLGKIPLSSAGAQM